MRVTRGSFRYRSLGPIIGAIVALGCGARPASAGPDPMRTYTASVRANPANPLEQLLQISAIPSGGSVRSIGEGPIQTPPEDDAVLTLEVAGAPETVGAQIPFALVQYGARGEGLPDSSRWGFAVYVGSQPGQLVTQCISSHFLRDGNSGPIHMTPVPEHPHLWVGVSQDLRKLVLWDFAATERSSSAGAPQAPHIQTIPIERTDLLDDLTALSRSAGSAVYLEGAVQTLAHYDPETATVTLGLLIDYRANAHPDPHRAQLALRFVDYKTLERKASYRHQPEDRVTVPRRYAGLGGSRRHPIAIALSRRARIPGWEGVWVDRISEANGNGSYELVGFSNHHEDPTQTFSISARFAGPAPEIRALGDGRVAFSVGGRLLAAGAETYALSLAELPRNAQTLRPDLPNLGRAWRPLTPLPEPGDAAYTYSPMDIGVTLIKPEEYPNAQAWRHFLGALFWRYGFPWPRIAPGRDQSLPVSAWQERWNRMPTELRASLGQLFATAPAIWRTLFLERMGLHFDPSADYILWGFRLQSFAPVALNEIANMLVRLRELSIQAASDTIGDTERQFVDREFQSLKQEIDRIANVTQFNGIPLLNGKAGIFEIQVGTQNNPILDRVVYNGERSDSTVDALKLGGESLATKQGAQLSLSVIDDALIRVNSIRADLGAMQNRLQATINNLSINDENMSAAYSRIRDADLAEEVSELTKANVLMQAGISVLAQANNTNSAAMKLLG